MAVNDEIWRWDDSRAVETSGAEAQVQADLNMMAWTGEGSVRAAAAMLLGRPRLADGPREESVQLHFKAPESMVEYVEWKTHREGLRTKSEYLRRLIERDMLAEARRAA